MTEPTSSSLPLLAAYCALILVASLAGGWIPMLVRPTHTRLQMSTSFVAGLMLGVGLLHLLPHSWHQLHSMDRVAWWLMGGFLAMFFLQRFFHFHHHDVPEERQTRHDHDHGHEEHDHGAPHVCSGHSLAEQSAQRLSWTGATLGLVLHTLIDGVAVAASVAADSHLDAHGLLAGLGTFLVVFLHKPFDAMAVGALMARGGQPRWRCHLVNGLLALAIPAGMVAFHFGLGQSEGTEAFVGAALAFSAGTFLCIATSDLLPELQFHAHDRWILSFALIAGLVLSALIGRFETSGHDHHEHAPAKSGPAENSGK